MADGGTDGKNDPLDRVKNLNALYNGDENMADEGTVEKNELVLTGRLKRLNEEKISKEFKLTLELETKNLDDKVKGSLSLKKIDFHQIGKIEKKIGNLMGGPFRIVIKRLNESLAVFAKEEEE